MIIRLCSSSMVVYVGHLFDENGIDLWRPPIHTCHLRQSKSAAATTHHTRLYQAEASSNRGYSRQGFKVGSKEVP